MADNNNLVNLGLHSNITEDEIRDALQGQPEPVAEDNAKSAEIDLGNYGDMLYESKDGVFGINNEFDAQQNMDFDQFKDQKWLFGLSTRVSGLDDGFTNTGIDDVYNRSQEAQGNLEKIRNGLFQFIGDTGINVAQGFGTLLYGLPSAVINGEFSKIYDNSLANALDDAQEKYDKYFDIKRGGNQSGSQKVTNFIFDDVLGGVSFVAGAILTELGLSAATVFTLGGAAPAQAAATAGIVARGSRILKQAINGGKRMIGRQSLDDLARAEAQLTGSASRQAAAAGIRQAGAAGARQAGSKAALLTSRQLLTGAGMESGMEARHMLNAAGEDHKREYEAEHGEGTYTTDMEEAFREKITPYGNAAFLANMALVGASNMLMFPKLFGSGLRNGLRQTKFVDTTKLSAKARQAMAKRMGIAEGQLPRLVDASRATRAGRNLRRLTPGSGVLGTALYEGFAEEGGQGVISRGFEDYISHRYDPRNQKDTANFVESFARGVKGSYGTAEGLKEVGIGMLLGAFGIPNIMIANAYSEVDPNTGKKVRPTFVGGFTQIRRENQERDEMMDRIIKLHEQDGDVGKMLAAEINNAVTQRGLIRQADIMANQNDFKGLKDNEANSIFSHASSKILTGRFEDTLIEAKEVLDSMTIEEYRELMGPAAMDMTDEELRTRKTKAYETYVRRMNEVRDSYRQAREVYRGENHDALNGIANLLYNVKDRDARERALADQISEQLKDVTGNQVLDSTQLTLELSLTNAQIDSLVQAQNELDAAENSQEREKNQEKINELRAKRDDLIAGFRATGKGKLGAYENDFLDFQSQIDNLIAYHRGLKAMGRTVTDIDTVALEELREDLREVQGDRALMINLYNELVEPGGYEKFIARMEAGINTVLSRVEEEEEDERIADEARRDEAEALGETEPSGMSPAEAQAQAQNTPDAESGPPGSQPPSAAMFEDLSQKAPDDSNAPQGPPPGAPPAAPAAPGAAETVASEEPTGKSPAELAAEQDQATAEVTEAEVSEQQQKPAVEPEVEPTGKSPAQIEAEKGKPAGKPVDNSEQPPQAPEKNLYQLKVTIDDPRETGNLNPAYPEAAADLAQHGMSVGEEITISRGRNENQEDVIHYSVRGNIFHTDPVTPENQALFNTLLQPRTARAKTVTYARFGGPRVTTSPSLRDVVSKDDLVEVGTYQPGTEADEFVSLTGEKTVLPVQSQPATTTSGMLRGKPYPIFRDQRSGEYFYAPAEMKSVGHDMALALLTAERAVGVVVTQDVRQGIGNMTLDSAMATVKNLEDAYGWDIRRTNGEIDKKRLVDSMQLLLEEYLMLEKDSYKAVQVPGHKTHGKRPALIYFANPNEPGLNVYEKTRTFSHKVTGEPRRSMNRSQRINGNDVAIRSVLTQLASMKRNVPFSHFSNPDAKMFGNISLDKETGIVSVSEPMSAKDYYFENLENLERVPLMVDGKTYGNFITDVTFELGPVEVPTDRDVTEGSSRVELTAEEQMILDDFTDMDYLAEESTEDSPMDRAGKLYSVEGLSQKVTQDAINFMTGRLATRMLRHSKTTERNSPLSAEDLKRQVRNDILELPSYQTFKKIVETDPSHARYEQAKKYVETFDKMLEAERFDRLMDLSFLEMLRESRGIIRLKSGNLADAVRELQEDRDEVLESQAKTADDIERDANPMAAFDDNFAFGVDPQSALRFELKLALMTVQHVHSNPSTVGVLGRKFVNQRTLIGHLNKAMAGAKYNWPAMKTRLEANVGTYPYFQVVLNMLDDASVDLNSPYRERELLTLDMMRNQFVVGMSKNIAEFLSLKVQKGIPSPDGRGKGQLANIFQYSSNDTNMVEFVMKELESRFIVKGFYTRQADGTVLVNKEKVREFVDALDNAAKNASSPEAGARALSAVLAKELGLDIPPQALSSANNMVSATTGKNLMAGIEKDLVNSQSQVSVLGAFRLGMRDVLASEDTTLAITDPGKSRERRGIPVFFALMANYQDNLIQNSSKDGSGKMRYQYTAPKHAQKMFHDLLELARDENGNTITDDKGRLVYVMDMEADWTLRNNPLLQAMRRPENKNFVKFGYLDGIKMLGSTGNVRDFHKMEPADRLFARLAYFGNNNTYRNNGKQMYSRHMMPTLADKHTMPLVQIPSLQLPLKSVVLEKPTEQRVPMEYKVGEFFNIQAAYDMTMRASIDMEITRIRAVQAGRKGEIYDSLDAKQRTNDRFVLMPALNGMQDKSDAEIHKAAKEIYENQLNRSFEQAMIDAEGMIYELGDDNKIKKFNFFNPAAKEFDYVRRHVGMEKVDLRDEPMNKQHAFMGFVAKYVIESLHFNTNVTTALLGDPGSFAKGNAEQTATNMGKRFAALIAPGNVIPEITYEATVVKRDKDGNPVVKNGKVQYETVTRSNANVRSLVMPERVIDEAEHLAYLKELGLTEEQLEAYKGYDTADAAEYTTAEEHLSILYAQGKIDRSEFEGILRKVNQGIKLNNEERGWFQPMKPVTVERKDGHLLYVKSASFPLVPGLTKNQSLDDLRVFMEKNNIQRAAYTSAVKVGNPYASADMIAVHDDAGAVDIQDGLENQIITYKRESVRIQQEVPVSKTTEKVHGSQVAKLILANLATDKVMFQLDGNDITGTDLHAEYMKARAAEQEARMKIFAKKYDMVYENGYLRQGPEYAKRMAARIVEEAIDRNYDVNELAHLQYDEKTGMFYTPLSQGPSADRIQQLLVSILRKELLEPKMSGFSGPIRPETGIQYRTLEDLDSGDITWVTRGGGVDVKKVADIEARREQELAVEDFDIARLKRKNGAIGTQGVTTEQVAGILKNVLDMPVKEGMSMREMVDMFKADPAKVKQLADYTRKNPIEVLELPDGTVQLVDGHHRAFLLDQAGETTVPATQKKGRDINRKFDAEVAKAKGKATRLFDGKKLKVAKYEQPNQIIMPWKYAGKMEEFMNEDGTLDMDKLPKEIFDVLAYRIPGQKKASSASFEIVGFLPKSYGDTLIVPEELVGQIGQDYDIDKMFGFLYETELVNGKLEVVRESTKESRPIRRVISGGQTGVDRIGLEVGKALGYKTGGVAPANFQTETGNDASLEQFGLKAEGSYRSRTIQNIQNSDGTVIFSEDLDSAGTRLTVSQANIAGKPVLVNPTAEELKAWLKDNKIGTLNVAGNRGSKMSAAAQNNARTVLETALAVEQVDSPERARKVARNRQIDIYHATLRSQDKAALLERHSPVTDGYSGELADQLGLMRQAAGMPMAYDYNDTKADVARSAKTAIGVFASQNVLHSQLEQLNQGEGVLEYVKINGKGERTPLHVDIWLDRKNRMEDSSKARRLGVTDIHDDTFLLDYEIAPTKITRQEQFSRLLNHAVDNENNQLLSKLNINAETWGFWTAMTHMGYNMETIALFMGTPLMQAHVSDASRNKNLVKGGRPSNEYLEMVRNAKEVLEANNLNSPRDMRKAMNDGRIPRLNKQDLLALAMGEQMSEVENAALVVQLHDAIRNLERVGGALAGLGKAMKFDTKMPKTRSEIDFERGMGRLALANTDRETSNSGLSSVSGQFRPQALGSTVSGQVFNDLNKILQDVLDLPGEAVYRTGLYNEMIDKGVDAVMEARQESDSKYDAIGKEFFDDYLGMTKAYLYAEWAEKIGKAPVSVLRQDLFLGDNNMAVRLENLRKSKPEVSNNLFIKHLIAESRPAKGYPRVTFQGDRQVNVSPIEIHAAFLALAQSKDAAVRKLAEDLVVYHLLQGRQLSAKGYGKYIPAELLQEYGLRDAIGLTNDVYDGWRVNEAVHDQVMLHMPDYVPFVSKEERRGENKVVDMTKKRVERPTAVMKYLGWFRTEKGLFKIQEVPNGSRDSMYVFTGPYESGGSYFSTEFTPGAEVNDEFKFVLDIKTVNKNEVENGLDSTNDADPNMPPHTAPDTEGVPTGMSPAEMASLANAAPAAPMPTDEDVPSGMSPAELAAMEAAAQGDRRPMTASEFVAANLGDAVNSNRLLRQLLAYESKLPAGKQVKIVVQDMANLGGYNRSTHTLKVQKQLLESGNKKKLARMLAHEMVHAYTSDLMSMDNKTLRAQYGPELVEAVEKVQNLYNELVKSDELLASMGLNKADLAKFKKGLALRRSVLKGEMPMMVLQADEKLLEAYDFFMNQENFKKYYGLTSAKEMVAELLSRPEFAQQLSQIKITPQETWLERIVKYIGDMLEGLGVEVRTGTYAHEAAALTMDLIRKNAAVRGVSIDTNALSMENNDIASDDMIDDLLEEDLDAFSLDKNTVAKMIDYKEKRIRELKELRSRYRKDKYLVSRLNERIGIEQREKALLDDSEGGVTLQDIVDMANRELNDAENVVRGANTAGDVRLAQSALQNALSVIEFYSDVRGIVKQRGPIRDEMNKLVQRASTLREDYHEKAVAILRAQAKAKYRGTEGEKYVKSDSFENVDDIGGLVSYFMDPSRQGRIELSFLDSVMKEAVRQQQVDFNARARAYMDKSKAMQKGAYFKKHKFNGFVQLDDKGNPTPHIIEIVGGKWETEHNKVRGQYEYKEPAKYYEWLHANTGRMDVDQMFDYSGDTVVRKNNLTYLRTLEKTYGKLGAEEMLLRQELLLQQFVDERSAEFDIIDVEESDPTVRERLKKQWAAKNDPSMHKEYIDGKKRAPKGSRNKYLFNMPKKEYHDARFVEMQEDAAAVEYYNEYRKQMREMMTMLPVHKMGNGLDSSQMQSGLFLPAIKRSLMNDIMGRNWSEVTGGRITDSMLRALTVTEEDLQSKLIDPVTGAKREELPVWFTNKLKDNADYEYNMDRSFLAFAMMATTYESKNKIEDTVRMTRGIMSQVKVTQRNNFGRQVLSKMGVPLASRTAEDRTRIMRVVDTMVNQFYGHTTVKDVTGTAPEFMWTDETKKRIAALREQLKNATTSQERDEIQQKIDVATPKVSAAKSMYGLQQWIQAKGMGWNLPAAATNLLYGTLAVEQYANGQQEFGVAEARKAMRTMMHSSLNNISLNTGATQTATAKKIQGMMITLDVLKDFTEIRFDPSQYAKNASEAGISAASTMGLKKLRMYEIQRSSEYFVYGAGTMAYLLATKVNGKSLWDQMDENGIIQVDGYRPGEEKHAELVATIDQINKRIHGNYDPNSPIAIKKTFYGPLLMQFKSWLPEAIAQRVEAERYDPYLDRTVKGRWWTLLEQRKQLHKHLLPMLIPVLGRRHQLDENLSKVDQENMRKSAANLRHMMYLYFMIQAIQALLDDEDDDTASKYALNWTMNVLNRAHNDQTAFMNPLAFDRLVGGGKIAALDSMNQLAKLTEATWDTAWGEPTIETGVYAGKSKMLHHGGKLIPHSAAIQRMINNLDRVLNN